MIDDVKGDESWRVFRIVGELTEGIDILADLNYAVSIFGSARLKPDSPYYQQAEHIARRLAHENFSIITGGGPGIMEAANKGASECTTAPDNNIKSVGLNILLPREQQRNTYQDVTLNYRHFFVRKVMFVKHSMGYVCMPGGFGTLDEFFEALTLLQTEKIYPIPLILFGVEFWQGLIDWVKSSMVPLGTISASDLDLLMLTDDIDLVVSTLVKHRDWKEQIKHDARP